MTATLYAPALKPAWMSKGKELEALWNAIVYHTQGDLFWIGEILLSEITKETGYRPARSEDRCR